MRKFTSDTLRRRRPVPVASSDEETSSSLDSAATSATHRCVYNRGPTHQYHLAPLFSVGIILLT
jgi:hypothetical protein